MLNIALYDSRQFSSFIKKKKIAFVQPRIPDGNYLPNLGIMILASVLLKEGYEVKIFDENIHDDIENAILEYSPDIIGFTCVTAAIDNAARTAAIFKNKLSKVIIVVGGPHLSAVPKETFENYVSFDYGFVGEAEVSFLRFCEEFFYGNGKTDHIPGLVYRNKNVVFVNRAENFLEDITLDQLPFPAWHLLPMEEIFSKTTHGLFSRGKRIMPVMTTRGCPNYCGFCCRVMGFKFRKQSLDKVLAEVQWLYDTYKIDEIYFEDDTFTQDPERAHALLDGIISLKLPIYVKFANGLRADKVDRLLLEKMKAAGVYWVGFGIESGSMHTQKLMRKFLDLELAAKNVKLAKQMGFKVGSNCIIGYPGETLKSIKDSIAYFLKLHLDSFAVVTCVPFPGTTAWQVCEKNSWFTDRAKKYENYWFEVFKVTPLIETPYLTAKDLSRAIFWVYVRFYFLNPKRLFLVARLVIKKKVVSINFFPFRNWLRILRGNSISLPSNGVE